MSAECPLGCGELGAEPGSLNVTPCQLEGGKEGEREREGVRERGTEGGVVEGMGKKGEDERETCHEQHNINSLIKTE